MNSRNWLWFLHLLSAEALLRNKQEDLSCDCELTAIEPYPNVVLREGVSRVGKACGGEAEDVALSMFSHLEENDILFIDSSHALAIGNDVRMSIWRLFCCSVLGFQQEFLSAVGWRLHSCQVSRVDGSCFCPL
jgi:hypothetical protein